MRIYERIIKSPGAPSNTSDLWLDTKQNPPALKCFHGGDWVSIASVSGGGGIDPSEDSDVVHYSDYHLFDWDDSKEGMQFDDEPTYTYYFYSEPEMAKKRSLFGSGCFINIDTQREYLFESDGDYKLYGNTTFSAAIIFLVAEGVNLPMPVPDGLIEGDGYVIVIENGGGK
jgi:hypothetical protein